MDPAVRTQSARISVLLRHAGPGCRHPHPEYLGASCGLVDRFDSGMRASRILGKYEASVMSSLEKREEIRSGRALAFPLPNAALPENSASALWTHSLIQAKRDRKSTRLNSSH